MFKNSKLQYYGLQKPEKIKEMLQDPGSKEKILPNFTQISNTDVKNINKFKLGFSVLLLPFDFEQAKKDFIKLYKTLYPLEEDTMENFQIFFTQTQITQEKIFGLYANTGIFRPINKILRLDSNPRITAYLRIFFQLLFKFLKNGYQRNKEKNLIKKVYRGGKISDEEMKIVENNKGGFIEIQGFLSTSLSKSYVLQNYYSNVLFEIQIPDRTRDPEFDNGFLHIKEYSAYENEDQVLFNAMNIFKIIEVIEERGEDEYLNKIIKLQYGGLSQAIYKQKNKLQLSTEQKRLLINHEHINEMVKKIKSLEDCLILQDNYSEAKSCLQKKISQAENESLPEQLARYYYQMFQIEKLHEDSDLAFQYLSQARSFYQEKEEFKKQWLMCEGERHLRKVTLANNKELKVKLIDESLSLIEQLKAFPLTKLSLNLGRWTSHDLYFYAGRKEESKKLLSYYEQIINEYGKIKLASFYSSLLDIKAFMLLQDQDFSETMKLVDEIAALNESCFGFFNTINYSNHLTLGCLFTRTHQYEKAIQTYKKGLSLVQKDTSNYIQFVFNFQINILHDMLKLNQVHESLNFIQEIKRAIEEVDDKDPKLTELFCCYYSLVAKALFLNRQRTEAFEVMDKAEEILQAYGNVQLYAFEQVKLIKGEISYQQSPLNQLLNCYF